MLVPLIGKYKKADRSRLSLSTRLVPDSARCCTYENPLLPTLRNRSLLIERQKKEVDEFTFSAEHSWHLLRLRILPIPPYRKRAESSLLFSSILEHYGPTSDHPGRRTRGLRLRRTFSIPTGRPNSAHRRIPPKIFRNTRRVTFTDALHQLQLRQRALEARAEDPIYIYLLYK